MHPLGCKPLRAALALAFGAGAPLAHAVYESPDGIGQALIYPYYTVQSAGGNAFNTYLSVVNTTSRAKAVRVRFREGKNGREVLDFNLFLSPNDVWTAALGPQDATAASPALLATADKSCTAPPIPAGGVAFRNFHYVGLQGDGGPTTLDRTREGYFEAIEMANLAGAASTAVTHNSAGVPANCAFVQPENGFRAGANTQYLLPPNGGVAGSYTLINVANGLNFAGNATALAELFAAPNYTDNATDVPNLASADPVAETVVPNAPGGGMVGYRATYATGRDAVSATLMKASVMNEYALDAATRSATDLVLTFPTKGFHVALAGGTTAAPFTATFGTTGACEPLSISYFNRESAGATVFPPQFGGVLPPNSATVACWASTVFAVTPFPITMTGSSVLGSANFFSYHVNGFSNGWTRLSFTGSNATSSGLTSTFGGGSAVDMGSNTAFSGRTLTHKGLPAIGFAARMLNNGLLNCTTFGGSAGTCVGSYGLLTDHRYSIVTTPAP